MVKIINAVPNDNHTLTIELSNNHRIIYDLRPRLQSTRFCGLADLKKFQDTVVAGTTCWSVDRITTFYTAVLGMTS
jgi:hypothetical protein